MFRLARFVTTMERRREKEGRVWEIERKISDSITSRLD
jgi:hypothetical protein